MSTKKEESDILSLEDEIATTAADLNTFLEKNFSIDWETRKEQICAAIGLSSNKTRPAPDNSIQNSHPAKILPKWIKNTLGRAVLGSPALNTVDFEDIEIPQNTQDGNPSSNVFTYSPEVAEKYANVVQDLNHARLSNTSFSLTHKFHEVAKSCGSDVRSLQLQDVWKIIREISGDSSSVFVPERKYANSYANIHDNNSLDALNLRRQIVSGAKSFLEKQFFEKIENNIARNPIEAQMGGVPSVFNKVRAQLNLKFSENGKWVQSSLEIINNVPIWALIYFMIRSGYLNEALEVTLSNKEAFEKLGSSFPVYFKAYVESPTHFLSGVALDGIRKEFNDLARVFEPENSDPYKFALFRIIGRCELARKAFPGVIETTEDWLWIHLSLIAEEPSTSMPSYEKYTLKSLQSTITTFGPKHFDPEKKSPGLYCQVLVMAGLFEQAISYVYQFSKVDAVHFAISLTYYGLLRPFSSFDKLAENLLTTEDGKDELNFARLIGTYTKEFRQTSPVSAVDYLVLICLNKDITGPRGREQLKLCHEALKELVLETREFSRLLGDIRENGIRLPGAIEERIRLIDLDNVDQYLQAITEQAAIKAEEDGRISDAVLLYQLSEEYDSAVGIINKSLGEMLSTAQVGNFLPSDTISLVTTTTDDPAQLARSVMEIYQSNMQMMKKVTPDNRDTCFTLLGIARAWDYLSRGAYEQCLREIDQLNILAFDESVDMGKIRHRAKLVGSLNSAVARNVPMLLIMVMRCCKSIFDQLNSAAYHTEGGQAKVNEVQGISRNCMIFAGMMEYSMPREVYMELTTLEIKI